MDNSLKNFSPASVSLGLGDILQDQLKIKSEQARQSALKQQGASDAQVSMSASTRSLFGLLNNGTASGGSALDALIS